MPVYLVGGVVRDLLLGGVSRDLDFVAEGNAIVLARRLQKKFGGIITTHQPFGTATWELRQAAEHILSAYPQLCKENLEPAPRSVDVITARSEWYPEIAQLPVERPGRIALDLRRRDFSVNSLAIRLDLTSPTLLDACEGISDLAAGRIRALHPFSFRDDPTRLFRAVRYAQRLGFQIEPETARWMQASLCWVKNVSGDRLRHELNLMLLEENVDANFRRMDSLGLLKAIHPGLMWGEDSAAAFGKAAAGWAAEEWQLASDYGNLTILQFFGYATWLANHDLETVRAVCSILRFSHAQTQSFVQLRMVVESIEQLRHAPNSVFVRTLEGLCLEAVYALDCLMANDQEIHQRIVLYRDHLCNMKPGITGDTLLNMNIPPGKLYEEVLTQLRDAWLDGEIHAPEEEFGYLKAILHKRGYACHD